MEKYFLNYLKNHFSDNLMVKYADYLKVDLDGYIYAYGDNMNKNYPSPRTITYQFWLDFYKRKVRTGRTEKYIGKDNILSFVAFAEPISDLYNLNLLGSFLQPIGDRDKVVRTRSLEDFYLFYSKLVRTYNFNEILSVNNCELLERFKHKILGDYKPYNFRALFVGDTEPFLYKYHIDIFKEFKKPSFMFLHGLPAIYNLESNRLVDYFCVWGEQIKENYINIGYDPSKLLVIGNRKYQEIPNYNKLRNDMSDVLVATTASVNWSPYGWDYSKFPLNDRSLIVLYSYSVQTVLQKQGVHHARLRVHPSVNKEWIMKFVDKGFYTIDTKPLDVSLNQSSLVIGPTSTVWLQSLLAGVNYLVYEPSSDKIHNLFNDEIVPPFDGSDEFLKVAFSEEDLFDLIKDKYLPDSRIIEKYIRPFDFSPVARLLK